MTIITGYSEKTAFQVNGIQVKSTNTATTNEDNTIARQSSSNAISTLARQLAVAEESAAIRDESLSRSELTQQASSINRFLISASYSANQEKYAAETPDSDDPTRLAQAEQATDYVANNGRNPFKGLTQAQLSLIVYDESGTFTVNERIAAYEESYEQEQEWRRWVCAKGSAESAMTGSSATFYKDVLSHYQALPLIEQAQYPDNYAERLQRNIAHEESHADTSQTEFWESDIKTLFELLMEKIKEMREQDEVVTVSVQQ